MARPRTESRESRVLNPLVELRMAVGRNFEGLRPEEHEVKGLGAHVGDFTSIA